MCWKEIVQLPEFCLGSQIDSRSHPHDCTEVGVVLGLLSENHCTDSGVMKAIHVLIFSLQKNLWTRVYVSVKDKKDLERNGKEKIKKTLN